MQHLYQRMYDNSITKVVYYNTFDLTKKILRHKNWLMIFNDFYQYMMGKQIIKEHTYEAENNLYPCDTKPIYEVICYDGKKYLTRGGFDMSKRILSNKRHICLHASINDQFDMTHFINSYPTSFNEDNNINLSDIICMMLLDNSITFDDFYKLIEYDYQNFIYIVDDETLEVRTYKDNETIIL
jgi:hypothetical protein